MSKPRPQPSGYSTVHRWLQRKYPKQGRCERCGSERYTEYALVGQNHVKDRSQYQELCKPCHARLDEIKPPPKSTHTMYESVCRRGHLRTPENTYTRLAELLQVLQ